jgi:DNA-binding NarL/FixJ family response regulator
MAPEAVRVLVVDDFPLVRDAMAASLTRAGIDVVGTAADGEEALDLARRLRPDVIVLDLMMPRMTGLMALTYLHAELPGVRVLLLTARDEPATIVDAVAAGAAGFLTKRATGEEVAAAVRAVHRGESVICPSMAGHLLAGLRGRTRDPWSGTTSSLSRDELEVLRLVAEGRTDLQISHALFISPRTVQSQLTRIRQKTGVRRRAELSRWAAEHLIS